MFKCEMLSKLEFQLIWLCIDPKAGEKAHAFTSGNVLYLICIVLVSIGKTTWFSFSPGVYHKGIS
jgi:hypothetical protein